MPFDRASCDRASLVSKYSSLLISLSANNWFNLLICFLYNCSLSLGVIVAGANEPGGSSDVEDDDAADDDAADADAAGNQRGCGAGGNERGCAGGATAVAERGSGVYDDAAADESRDENGCSINALESWNKRGCSAYLSDIDDGCGVYDRDDDATAVAERGSRIYDINTCSILLRVFVNMS